MMFQLQYLKIHFLVAMSSSTALQVRMSPLSPNLQGLFGRYPATVPGEICSWLISPPAGYDYISISLSYQNFSSYDYMYVYDGSSANSLPLGYFTTSSTTLVINTSQGSVAYVVFTSYSFSNAGYFVLSYTAMYGSPPSSTSTSGTTTFSATTGIVSPTSVSSTGSSSCSSIYLSGETGNDNTIVAMTRLGYFSHLDYGSNEYCYWFITPPASYTSIVITFTFFELEQAFGKFQLNFHDLHRLSIHR